MATKKPAKTPPSLVHVLHQVSRLVSSNLTLDEMLGEVVGLAVQATACDACLVYLIDSSTDEVVLRASQVPHATALGNLRMHVGEGVTGWVAEHKSVVALSSNATRDGRFKLFQGLVEDTYEALLSVPLVSAGDLVGVINVHHRDAHDHTHDEIGTLVFIGEQLGVDASVYADSNTRISTWAERRKGPELPQFKTRHPRGPRLRPARTAEPEVSMDWACRRLGCDIYLFGSMVVFMFVGVQITAG